MSTYFEHAIEHFFFLNGTWHVPHGKSEHYVCICLHVCGRVFIITIEVNYQRYSLQRMIKFEE